MIYRSTIVYRLTMVLLYRRSYRRKYAMVAELIEPGSSVVDLCCGDCAIEPMLAAKDCRYVGLDSSESFVKAGKKRGLNVSLWNGPSADFPSADVICMQSSLYQFMPDEKKLVERMISKSGRMVIITEPVKNLADSRNPIIRKVARWVTPTSTVQPQKRHTLASIQALVRDLPGSPQLTLPIEREAMIVINKPPAPSS